MEEVDLSGDGGVLKKILKMAKPDAVGPTEDLPLVDCMFPFCL
jgi:peptidylprolyl isomerase